MSADQALDLSKLRITPFDNTSCLQGFDSGESEINRNVDRSCERHNEYRRRVFCAFVSGKPRAVGFYCLGIAAPEAKYLSEKIVRGNEGQAYVPFIYLNYLAVQKEYQNKGVGTILLMNALERCVYVIKNIGIYGVGLNAITDRAAGLYERYGFQVYDEKSSYPFMVLPAQSLLDLFS